MSPRADTRFFLPEQEELSGLSDRLLSQGFVHLESVIALSVLAAVSVELTDVAGQMSPEAGDTIVFDDTGEVLSMHGLDRHSAIIFDLARDPAMLGLASSLLGGGVVPFLTEYFAKPVAGSLGTPPHQDQAFYQDHFSDELAVTFWCPLTEVTLADAPLEYGQPAQRPGCLLPHRVSSAVANFGRELDCEPPSAYIAVPASPGDIVIHHAYAVHRAQAKITPGPRRALAMNYRTSPFRRA